MTLAVEELRELPAAVTLRAADERECTLGPIHDLTFSARNSINAYVAKWGGEPFAYWGWTAPSLLSEVAGAWMLTTPLADRIPTILGRLSIRLFRKLHQFYPRIVVGVDPTHTVAIRWLEWLGFTHLADTDFRLMISNREDARWAR